jgi:hypothetical protein
MFSRKFVNDHKEAVIAHNAIYFGSRLTNKQVIEKILKEGLLNFIKEDNANPSWGQSFYNDNRIDGKLQYATQAACCAFTKTDKNFYIFPIHEEQLKNVGLNGDDLLKWLNFLNTAKIGLKYYYLGHFAGNDYMHTIWRGKNKHPIHSTVPTNEYHWVMIPRAQENFNDTSNTLYKVPYFGWIALRWLINTFISNQGNNPGENIPTRQRLAYYNLPRIAMMLHEDFGLTKLRSILYANAMHPFYYYYSLCYSDRLFVNEEFKFDVSVKAAQFKGLLRLNTWDGSMNSMLTAQNVRQRANVREVLPEVRTPYNWRMLHENFLAGKYEDCVNHIKQAYKITKPTKTKVKAK